MPNAIAKIKATTVIYGLCLAFGVFVLQWVERQHILNSLSTEVYIVILAALFTALGVWVGACLNQPTKRVVFEKNTDAINAFGISNREYQVLELLAGGYSNQEIATLLFVSKSTIKTHLVHLYQKLGVSRRIQAVQKAKALNILS